MRSVVVVVVMVTLVQAVLGDEREDFDLFPGLPFGVVDTENVICREQSRMYVEHLRNLSLWAYQMRDSTAKSVTGLLTGNIFQFGQYEECLKAKSPFATQYCLASITADVPKPDPPRDERSLFYEPNESVLRKIYKKSDPSQQPENVVLLGWCVPASCRPVELQAHLNRYLANLDSRLSKRNVSYRAEIGENSCQTRGENDDLDHVDISFGLVVLIVVSLVTFSSVYDLLREEPEDKLSRSSQLNKLLTTFSLRRNLKKLAASQDSNQSLRILYGVRVFCICMIIMDHRFGTHIPTGVMNFNKVEEQYRSALGSLFFHGDLFVDSFFMLSGMLVTYCLLVQYEKRILNPMILIFLRYVRLTPLYAFVIFYYATVFKYIGEGPMWKTIIGPEVQDCRENWWTNILYINNYVNVDHMCMVQSWYLPCDLHYFIIAVLLCVLISKKRRAGLIVLALINVVAVVVPFVTTMVNKTSAVIYFYPEFLRQPKQQSDFMLSYTKSHTRASPYFVGMAVGYVYYRMKGSEKYLKRGYSHLILVLSVFLMVSSILTGIIFYDPEYQYDAVEAGLYASLHRTVWAIGSVGVLYVASYGHARLVYRFLAWKPWIPISKLVYGAYLVHFQYQLRSLAKKGGADIVTYFDVISLALSDVVLSFGTAFVLYLTVESPIRNIFGLLLVPQKEVKEKSNGEENTSEGGASETTCDSHL